MYPQTQVIKILNHLKKNSRGKMFYKVGFNEVEISMCMPASLMGENVVKKCFTFEEILKWHNNPDKYFKESWCKND